MCYTIYTLSLKEHILKREEFLKLVAKHQQGTATESEVKLIEKFYDSIQDHSSEEVKNKLSAETGERLFQAITSTLHKEQKSRTRPLLDVVKVAAAFALLFVVGIAIKHITDQGDITVTTAAGELREIQLHDGSIVTLAENSTLTYPNAFGNTRDVSLEGRAFFDVHRDAERPFSVHTDNAAIKVLGTSFDVNANAISSTTVSVISGKVQVSPKGLPETKVLLTKHQQVTSADSQLSPIQTFRGQQPIAWTNLIMFKNTSLEEAAEALEDRFELEVHFESDALKKERITGKFKDETLDNILKSIALLKQFTYEYQNDHTIYIKRK